MDKHTAREVIEEISKGDGILPLEDRSFVIVLATIELTDGFDKHMTDKNKQHWRNRVMDSLQHDVNHLMHTHTRSVELLTGKERICSYDAIEFEDPTRDVSIDAVARKIKGIGMDVTSVSISDFAEDAVNDLWVANQLGDQDTIVSENVIVAIQDWDITNIFDYNTTVFTLKGGLMTILVGTG